MATAADFVQARPLANRLENMPVAFFSIVMGLAGLAIASVKAEAAFGLPVAISLGFAILAAVALLVIALLYLAKCARHPDAVLHEFNHPVKLHFFPTVSISLILLSIVALHYSTELASVLFAIGVPLHLAFTLAVLHYWFNRDHFETVHLNPAWFIPIVGNVLVPISGVGLGFIEVSWFYFSIGIVFWVVLFSIITNRVMFHHPLPERLAPTLFILIAPPAVGFLSYVRLTGAVDPFARVLFYFALFMTLFLLVQVPRLVRMRFFLSWWAYSFPLAAMTVATWVMHEQTGQAGFMHLATAFSVLLTLVIAALSARTLVAIWYRQICLPE